MIPLSTGALTEIAVVGAHCDDIAIGMGGTLLTLAGNCPGLRVRGLVLSGGGTDVRRRSRGALAAFCPGADVEVTVLDIPDGRAPAHWERIKDRLSDFRRSCHPDVVFGPQRDDAHQDHRLLAELLPTEFRDHLVLGYEILKWEADTPRPTILSPARHRGGRGEGAAAAQALSVPDEPRLVRRASVSRRCPGFAGCSATRHTRRPSFWRRRRSHSRGADGAGGIGNASTGHRASGLPGHGHGADPAGRGARRNRVGLRLFRRLRARAGPDGSAGHAGGPAGCDARAIGGLRGGHPPRRVVQRPTRCVGAADHLRHQPSRLGPVGPTGERGRCAEVPLRLHLLGVRGGWRGSGHREMLRCDR